MDEWRKNFPASSPLFDPVRGVAAALAGCDHWPSLDDYNALLNPPIHTAGGSVLGFVPQAGKPARMEDKYEARIYLQGEVQTRTENWHDLFNALVWLAFPLAKITINARHFESISQSTGDGNRDRAQDALTLFDESGLVVLYSDDDLAHLLEGFQWHELFHVKRQAVNERMRFMVFGHSLYEKALKPYIGFTGKGLLLRVDAEFFSMPMEKQLKYVDERVADRLSLQGTISSSDLSPVPLLGVPGWWRDNEDERFYANERYFRAPRNAGRLR